MPEIGFRKWIITITVVMSAVIELIDTTVVNVSLPQMMGNLGATLDEIAWVVTAYVVGNVLVVPMAGWFSAIWGRRNYFAGSIALFTLASFFCGHATTIGELVLFRFLQGLGGGALMTTSQAILIETFPREQIGLATALFGMGVVVGPTIGPTLGGWITDNYTWPWVFYINLPIGTVAALLAFTYIRDPEHRRQIGAIDWPGIALLVGGVGSIQVVLERGQREDWFATTYITVLAVVAAICVAAFVWRELTTDHPVVDLRVLRNRSLAVGTLFAFIMGVGLFGSVFIFPIYVQGLLGFTATQTGLILLPGALTTAFMMPLVGRLMQKRFPPQLLNAIGFSMFFVFSWMISLSTLSSDQADFLVPLIVRGIAFGCLFVPLTALALGDLPAKDLHQGTGLTNMMRQLGGSLGVALIATFVEHHNWDHRQELLRFISPYDPAVQQRLHALTQGLMARGSSFLLAQQQAYAALEGTVVRQTLLLTYMEAFRWVGVFFLVSLPMLLLFPRRRRAAVRVDVH